MDLIRHTNPPELSKPTGYTHVVEVNRGRTVYIAGQVSFDASGGVVGKQDFTAQTRQVMENLKAALASVGATFENVVKVNTYVTDMSQIQALREIRTRYDTRNGSVPPIKIVGKSTSKNVSAPVVAADLPAV